MHANVHHEHVSVKSNIHAPTLLGCSGVVISGVISEVNITITHIRGLVTPLMYNYR